jgi:hypothetical protein
MMAKKWLSRLSKCANPVTAMVCGGQLVNFQVAQVVQALCRIQKCVGDLDNSLFSKLSSAKQATMRVGALGQPGQPKITESINILEDQYGLV